MAFDQLYETAREQQWTWSKTASEHEVSLGVSAEAFQILFDQLSPENCRLPCSDVPIRQRSGHVR